MRFLCVECDEPMSMDRTRGPNEGSMTVVFACPECRRETAMLTNAMETQVVRSLGVSIGGREDSPAPMETVRSQLEDTAHPDEDEATERSPNGAGGGETGPDAGPGPRDGASSGESNCPFTGTVEAAYAERDEESSAQTDSDAGPEAGGDAARRDGPRWTEKAEERLERIPPMARKMARRGIEEYAREEGLDTIDEGVMDELKGQFRI